MTTYTLLIYRTAPPTEPIPRKEEKQVFLGHRVVQAEASQKGELHSVARLDNPETARTVRALSSGHNVTDGPFIEAKEWLVGFYLVDCEDEAQALERAKQLCADRHHVIEVRPVTWRWRE